MANVLQPDKTSNENILLFLDSIEDEDLRQLLLGNLDEILAIGAGRGNRDAFFEAVSVLIDEKLRGTNENSDD